MFRNKLADRVWNHYRSPVLRSTKRAPANARRHSNRKWRQRYCLVGERSRALALLNAALSYSGAVLKLIYVRRRPPYVICWWTKTTVGQSDLLNVASISSSLAKGFAHGPLSLHPWHIELDFVIHADRHQAVITSPAYKDDITFDQWVLLTVSC